MIPGMFAAGAAGRVGPPSDLRSAVQALFAKYSAAGGMWDFLDSATLRQSSAGTGAVGDGDPIGYADDLSGVGAPAVQATSNKRPLFSAASGAVFDGSNDGLTTSIPGISTRNKAVVAASYIKVDDTPRMAMELGPAYGRNRFFLLSGNDGGAHQCFYGKGDTDNQPRAVFTTARPNGFGAHVGRVSFPENLTQVWWGGIEGTASTINHGTGTFEAATLNIGSRNNGASLVLNSGMRRAIVLASSTSAAQVTDGDLDTIRQWLADTEV